jgi:hypothetical protein
MSEITERVERGAALLDEKRPGWWRDIDLDMLDVRSRCGCVIGQLGGLTKAADRGLSYQIVSDRLGVGYYDEIPMGFEAEGTRPPYGEMELLAAEYAALTEAWRVLILARREQAAVTA